MLLSFALLFLLFSMGLFVCEYVYVRVCVCVSMCVRVCVGVCIHVRCQTVGFSLCLIFSFTVLHFP